MPGLKLKVKQKEHEGFSYRSCAFVSFGRTRGAVIVRVELFNLQGHGSVAWVLGFF